MGKEWYWGGSSKSSSSKRGLEKYCTSNSNTTAATSGCMSAVFQLFDFHHFQFSLNHHHASSFKATNDSFLPEDHSTLKGAEAPRNSLELEEPPFSSSSINLKEEEVEEEEEEEEEEETSNIPRGIQIRTSRGVGGRTRSSSSKVDSSSSSSEISSSPGAKTPNLVARQMGLDLLPVSERQSPSYPSSSSCHETPKSNMHHHFRPRQPQHGKLIISHRRSLDVDMTTAGTRSLPETPRISSARRSDVDYHHRLSLQFNKENVNAGEEVEFSRFSYLRRKELKQDDEHRSPSQYARQIVKQVKESVSRKVGLDITNTLRNNRGAEQARERDELVSQLKAKKSYSKVLNKVVDQSSPGKHSGSTPSCSPRLSRFLEPKQKVTTLTTTTKENTAPHQQPRKSSCEAQANTVLQPQQPIKVLSSKSKLRPVQEQEKQQHIINEQRPAKKFKKATAGERFTTSRLKKPPQTTDIIRNKQEEVFVRPSTANKANCSDKKCKQTPLSNGLLNITVPTLLPVKKDRSPPATKLPQKQVLSAQNSRHRSQLSSNTCQTYKQETSVVVQGNIEERLKVAATATTNRTNTSTGVGEAEEYEYVTRILNRTGINKDTPVSFTKWFSPFHPLDPSIFHHLENMNSPIIMSGKLSHICNRKLMFGLVDEILVDILKPYINMKPWVSSSVTVGRGHMQGSELMDTLCMQIRSCPRANCQVLEDIDGLIDKDLPPMKLQKQIAFEEEGEGVVTELEKDILDKLILETAAEFGVGQCGRRDETVAYCGSKGRGRNWAAERQEAEGSHGRFT